MDKCKECDATVQELLPNGKCQECEDIARELVWESIEADVESDKECLPEEDDNPIQD